MITISHTHADGTVLTGSTRGDGVYEIVKRREHGGFTWRPVPGIFLRGSRDMPAQTHRIEAAAAALRAAGHQVTVEINDQPRPTAVREADRASRAEDRADRLADRAGRAGARGTALYEDGRDRLDRIPTGQPILAGHHSETRDRRYRDRALTKIEAGLAELDRADHLTDRAEALQAHQHHRTNPRVTMRRIKRLETDLRAAQRHGRDTAHLVEEIAHWQALLAAYEADGTFVPWRPADISKGDHIQVDGGDGYGDWYGDWYVVKRVNAHTVSVISTSWPSTVPYDQITGRRRAGMQLDAPNGQPWPVEVARKVARWHRLQHTLALPTNRHSHDAETVRKRLHAAWARRITLDLPTTATDAEVAAFTAPNLDTARTVAATCMDIYDRLQAAEAGEKAGEKPNGIADSIAASITPVDCGEPSWRMPTGTPQDRRVDQLQPGDIIAGCWERPALGGGDRRLVTGFAGPVQHVSAVVDRHERGRWIQIRLADGSEHHYQTHVWFAVHPGAARHPVEQATAGPDLA